MPKNMYCNKENIFVKIFNVGFFFTLLFVDVISILLPEFNNFGRR